MAPETNFKSEIPPFIFNTRQVMKKTLVVSLILHLCVLLGLQKTFPIDWIKKPFQTYHVELMRMPVDPLEDLKGEKAELGKINSEKKTLPQETEDTISLDTKDQKYMPYAKRIKAQLMQQWKYPNKAWENLVEGDVLVLFSLDRSGNLTELKILKTSGHEVLDKETERTVKTAAPFPSFPGSVTVTKLNIKANFVYRLTEGKL